MPCPDKLTELHDSCRKYPGGLPHMGCPTCGRGDLMIIGSICESNILHYVVACSHCQQALVVEERIPEGDLILDIVTPCSRPGNLQGLCDSILNNTRHISIHWHIVLDCAHQHDSIPLLQYNQSRMAIEVYRDDNAIVSPGRMRNQAMRKILPDPRRWVCFLDDDNLMHPNAERILIEAATKTPLWGYCVSCDTGDKILEATAEKMKVGSCDMAQLFVNSCLVNLAGGICFTEWGREEDGVLIERLFLAYGNKMGLINQVASYHDGGKHD